MSSFRGGPLDGKTLSHSRAPLFLRVTVDGDVFDVLDLLTDEPKPQESVHVYRRVSEVMRSHLLFRGRLKHLTGWYEHGEYEHVPDVDGESVRDTEAWRRWATAQTERRDDVSTG